MTIEFCNQVTKDIFKDFKNLNVEHEKKLYQQELQFVYHVNELIYITFNFFCLTIVFFYHK